MSAAPPRLLTLVAELTYACRLRCAYCSNPTQVSERRPAMSTADWLSVIDDAASLGALQVHFTGGEPLLFRDLEMLVRRARERQLYTNLITSGVPLERRRLEGLVEAGIEHVQVSLHAATPAGNVRIAGIDTSAQKWRVAQWVKELGLPLTLNIVLHRENIGDLERLIELAEAMEPHRIEIANAQYLGWALVNREQLLPSATQMDEARRVAQVAQARLRGKTDLLMVLPDYYANRPRACMQGLATSYLVVTPDGLALPCHASRELPGLNFDDVRGTRLTELWSSSRALQRFRDVSALPDACRTCSERDKDHGGCRCQAFALTGDVAGADPACSLTPAHSLVREARRQASLVSERSPFTLRHAPRPSLG
jgi:pyrroloquinoline quinone biosynthesis protein E